MTTLKVSADTKTAVGAFDELTKSLQRARDALSSLQGQTKNVEVASRSWADTMSSRMPGAFQTLQNAISGTLNMLTRLGVGVQFVFSSLLKEIDKIQGFNAIMSVTTGSAADAAKQFNFLRGTADVLGVQFDSLSNNYAKLVAAIPEGNDRLAIAQRVFLGVASAARTLHASNQDTQLMFYAVTQIASKGVVSMEELRRQLGEKLPGALNIAAKALNTTTTELEAMIRKGLVDSVKFLPIFGEALVKTFTDSAAIASTSVSAGLNRLTNVWVDFTKTILDSGAGTAIVGVFDALREKLSDPYLIEQFARLVGYLSGQITDFIKALTMDDIRNGFDSFASGTRVVVNALGLMIDGLTWVINNSGKIGTIIGMMYGAAKGAAIGSLIPGVGSVAGMGVGAVLGAVGGGAAGVALGAGTDTSARTWSDMQSGKANAEREAARQLAATQIEALLKQFNFTMSMLPNLMKPERQTRETVEALVGILGDSKFKTQTDRATAFVDYARYGFVPTQGATLGGVLRTGGKKPGDSSDSEAKALQRSMWEGFGFQGDFKTEWDRYGTLYKQKKIDVDELTAAQARLLEKQPAIKAFYDEEAAAMKASDKEFMGQIRANERMANETGDFQYASGRFVRNIQRQENMSGASEKDRYLDANLGKFDEQAIQFKREMVKLGADEYQLAQADAVITIERVRVHEELLANYELQRSATMGLTRAQVQLFDVLENRGAQAADMFKSVVGGMQDVWTEFIMTGKINIQSFVQVIQMEIAKITWARLMGPMAASAGNFITSLFFENGGIMTSQGALPLEKYSLGGVANSPQVAVYGEGRRPEAYVPLPDGRTIPVTMKDSGGGPTIIVNQTVNVGQGVSRSEVASAMVTAKNAAVGEIRNNLARRGSV